MANTQASRTKTIKSFWVLLAFIFLAGCNDSGSNTEKTISTIQLSINTSIQENIDHSAITFPKDCIKKLSLCWYEFSKSANESLLPEVAIKTAASSLTLKQVTNITMLIDKRIGEDVEDINISLQGLPDNTTHEENIAQISALLADIRDAGWTHFFMPEDPRISGSQADKIATPATVLGQYVGSHPWLDPDYQLDLKRWLEIGSFYNWYFYNNGIYLHLKAWKRDDETAPSEKATYLTSLEFKSERAFWTTGITDESDRTNWKSLLPKRLENYRAIRLAIETKARASGIEIDETYQDPPIQALKK
ncbi:hypothetical protein ACW9H6_26825 [Pseudomonas sp. SDO528_S397]